MTYKEPPKALVLVGPTASGKSSIAIALAKKYNGEIVSCDSRQVYRGMDKGTGKVPRDLRCTIYDVRNQSSDEFFSEKIRHHMIDIVSPKTPYNVAKFQKKANVIIKDILNRGKLPILCGGTGLWAQAVVENMTFPTVAPDTELRNRLQNTPTEELLHILQKLNPERAQTIDPKNRHRLVRAIEIARNCNVKRVTCNAGKEVSQTHQNATRYTLHATHPITWLVLAVNPPREVLFEKIEKRLDERLEDGMIDEVALLHKKQKISWTRLNSFGLEYRWITRYLQQKISLEIMREKLLIDIRHYAKRQLTWLKRWEKMGRKIHWTSSVSEAEERVKNFLEK